MIHTVNLPVESLNYIINIDDVKVLTPVEELVKSFESDPKQNIRSMFSIPDINEKIVKYTHEISYITSCTKNEIKKTNEIRYFKIRVKYFPSEKEKELILPSYVKLFSRTAKSYVPVEFIRKSDILTDYAGNIVQVLANEQETDFKPTEFYSIKLSVANNSYPITFYLDGIFANVFYNSFELDEEDDSSEGE